jgi:hypothetical protein
MVTVLRPLSTSELLDRTFHLYRNNFLVFVGITAIPQLFILPLLLGGAAMTMRRQETTSIIMTLAGYLLFYLAVFVSQAPTIVAVSNLHLEKSISIRGAYSLSRGSLPRVIWIVFLLFLVLMVFFGIVGITTGIVVGLVAAGAGPTVGAIVAFIVIVPAMIFAVRWMLNWSLVIPVTVLEGGWFRVSIRRSSSLTKGSRWRIFVVYFLLGLFAAIVSFVIQTIMLLSISLFGLRDLHAIQSAMQAVQAVAIFISTSVVGALATIALSLIYYDQRVRKEGFDLQLMMATLQPSPQSSAAVSTA